MKGMNRVVLVGNLGRDPEVKVVGDGLKVARISLATTEIFRVKDGSIKSDTQWHTVIFWRVLAELAAKYLRNGSLIYLEGRLKTRAYKDARAKKRYVTEIIGDKFIMLDKRPSSKAEDWPHDILWDDPPPF